MSFIINRLSKMNKTYVLVHGAWHGGWCWRHVTPILKAQGHNIFAPDLPGHGLDNTPFEKITLKTYVDSILSLINRQVGPVILVGHSMSGVVISQVAEYVPEKIEQLVYTAGFIPDYSGTLLQEESQAKVPTVAKEIVVDERNNEISLKVSKLIRSYFYNTCQDADASWALMHLQKQPFRPFVDPVKLSDERFGRVEKLYIECLRDQAIRIEDQRRMYKKLKCKVISLDTDHSPFLSNPAGLAKVLININARDIPKQDVVEAESENMPKRHKII